MTLKEKLEEELDKLVEGLVPSKQAEIRFFMKMAYEEGRKSSCITGHCEHSKVAICHKCFKERNKSLT